MARLFDDASSEYLYINQAIVSGLPFAVVCLFNTDDADPGEPQALIGIGDKDTNTDSHQLFLFEDTDNVFIHAQSFKSPTVGGVSTSISVAPNIWHHAAALFVATNDRRVLVNAGSKGTNNTVVNPVNLDCTAISKSPRDTAHYYVSGLIAEAAIYDLSVWPGATASDKADNFEKILPSLTKGFTPLFYPLGLKAYWPLIRGLNDRVGGYNLTASGTTVSAHPRVIMPHGAL